MAKRKREQADSAAATEQPQSPLVKQTPTPPDDRPTAPPPRKQKTETPTFNAFSLDPRLLQTISKQKYATPTPIQSSTIPLIQSGKSVIARARTGSGKTAAYLLPLLNDLLASIAKSNSSRRQTSLLILAPTRELAEQITRVTNDLLANCAGLVRAVNASSKISDQVLKSLLADQPDVVVSTPWRIATCLAASSISLSSLNALVVDEADLVLSYGYEDDLRVISAALSASLQMILISATLPSDIEKISSLLHLADPTVLDLPDPDDSQASQLTQYIVHTTEEDKFLLLYVMFKLKLIKGKAIVFVGDIDRGYRVKLFLEQFGIRSCVLNSELPVNSRLHVVEEFNKGVYEIVIASDEHEVIGDEGLTSRKRKPDPEVEDGRDAEAENDESAAEGTAEKPAKKSKHSKYKSDKRSAKEYGVSRGLDFQLVSLVLNFDLPNSARSYTHRIGRTARAHRSGTAMSFVIPKDEYGKHPPTSFPGSEDDERVLAEIVRDQCAKAGKSAAADAADGTADTAPERVEKGATTTPDLGRVLKPFTFNPAQLSPFRYRLNDALRSVTRKRVREARIGEVRRELLNSEKLKDWWKDNGADLRELREKVRHDEVSRGKGMGRGVGLKDVPGYLVGKGSGKVIGGEGLDVPFNGRKERRGFGERKGRGGSKGKGKRPIFGVRGSGGQNGGRRKGVDPLRFPGMVRGSK